MDYLTTHTSLSPIQHGFVLGFVNYKPVSVHLAEGFQRRRLFYTCTTIGTLDLSQYNTIITTSVHGNSCYVSIAKSIE
jgi:hypothetical protein